jgi:hypothetical protein
VNLEKDSFYADEKPLIRIELDNSKCDKNVKEIKMKIWRHIKILCTNGSSEYIHKDLIISQPFPGLKHGRNEERIIEVDLTIFGDSERRLKKQLKKKNKDLLPEDIALQSNILPTTNTQLINVSYTAEVHFYHNGMTWNSKLPPGCLPIKIYPS